MRLSSAASVFVVGLVGAVSAGCGASCPQAGAAPASALPATGAGGAPVTDAAASATDKLSVVIAADGAVHVDGKDVAADAVADAVAQAHPDPSTLEATIFADDLVPHGKVVQVLEQLRRAGIVRLGIVVGPAAATASAAGAAPASAPGKPTPPAVPAAAASGAAAAAPPALPEVKVENIGLHIGGGPNDDASKLPFKRSLEAHFDDFRKCYALAEDPAKGGTFGVDLHVGRDGGKPEVKQPRTGMKGKAFHDCMVEAFGQVEFDKPHKPVVFSYSLRFTVGG